MSSVWFDPAHINENRQDGLAADYCTAPQTVLGPEPQPDKAGFWYKYCNHSSPDGAYNEFWCDDDVQCVSADPTEAMWKQTPTDLWAVTYVKDKKFIRFPCGTRQCNTTNRELLQNMHD